MQLNDLMRVSVRQVIRHRRRYMGVVLAIALGVAGFLNIVTMSREVKKNFNENLDLIGGVTVLRIYFDNQRSYRPQWFREQTLNALKRLDGVKELSLTAVKYGQASNVKGHHFGFMLLAVDEGFWPVRNFWPLTGKLFGLDAVTGRNRECVLGAELAKRMFGDTQVTGKDLEINREIYRISGVLGGVTDSGLANSVFLPLTTAVDRFPGRLLADRLYVRCATWDDVGAVAAGFCAAALGLSVVAHASAKVAASGSESRASLFMMASAENPRSTSVNDSRSYDRPRQMTDRFVKGM